MPLLSKLVVSFLTVVLVFFSAAANALPPMNLPYGVTPVSHKIYHLHMIAFYICCAIGVVVFGALIYFLWKYRRSKGAKAKDIHEHLGVEILWTVIPFVLLVIMAIPATKVLMQIHNTDKPELDIKVTGYQWRWKYDYLDQGIAFFSNLSTPQDQINDGHLHKDKWYLLEVDHPLVVPVHEKIRFLVTANDVIHSWWVPDLGLKQDAIPGYINENWAIIDTPGIYRGQCAELCGANHGFMPIVVKAVSKQDFAKWVQKQHKLALAKQSSDTHKTFTQAELIAMGKTAYGKYCGACHQGNGKGLPPTFPALQASPVVTGPVRSQIGIVLNGVDGTPMQAFASQLDDKTLAAIITYTRHAWGNDQTNTSEKHAIVVQPKDIKAARS